MNNYLLKLIINHDKEKCGFPLAEERKKQKMFFSHMAGSLGTGLRGVFRSRGSCKVSVFVLPSVIA